MTVTVSKIAEITNAEIKACVQGADIDESIRKVQDKIGVESGDVAAQAFSDIYFNWDTALTTEREEKVRHWLTLESYFAEDADDYGKFRLSAKWSDNLASDAPDYFMSTDPQDTGKGYRYLGNALVIEQVQPDWPDNARKQGEWYLRIGNLEWISNDRPMLERILYQFAKSSGYFDD